MRDGCFVFDGVDFTRPLDVRCCSRAISMKNLLAEEWEPLPDGLLVLKIEIRAGEFRATKAMREKVSGFMDKCQGDDSFDLMFLSAAPPMLGWFCSVHGHIEGAKVTHFGMRMSRKPKPKAPKSVAEASKSLGGYPEGLDDFLGCIGAPTVSCRIAMTGVLLESQKPLRIAPNKWIKDMKPLRLTGSVVRFDHPRLKGRVEIEFPKSNATKSFKADSTIPLALDASCFNTASEHLGKILTPVFKSYGKTH